MRKFMFVCSMVFVLGIASCAAVDWLAGGEVVVDPVTGEETYQDKPGPSPLEIIGKVGGVLLPWIPEAATALTAVLIALRGKKYKDAAVSTFAALESYLKANPEHEEKLKRWLAVNHVEAGTYDTVKALLDAYVNSQKPEPPATPTV